MRYFIADTHFGHTNSSGKGDIIKMMARVAPNGALFTCQEEHDAHIIDRINSLVGPEDELIIVGDFAFRTPEKYRAKIKCRHLQLVLGNHDKKAESAHVFNELRDIIYTESYNHSKTDYVKLCICHYPMLYWNGSHKGWGHLYGHCHGQREEYLDTIEPERRALDVGVDNIYRLWGKYDPLSEIEVFEYMARRSGHDDIRFYDDYQMGLYIERGLYRGNFLRFS